MCVAEFWRYLLPLEYNQSRWHLVCCTFLTQQQFLFLEIMTRFLKIIPRPCCEQFHVRTIFFLLNQTRLTYHCTDRNMHLLMNKDRVGCKRAETSSAQAQSEHCSLGALKLETQKLNLSVWVHFGSRQPLVTSFQTLAEHVHMY